MNNQSQQQKEAFKTALQSGALRELAIARGGTGDLRKPLTDDQYKNRKNKNKMAKMSRKANRGR